jgi:ATP-binding cassette subfamily F protein uup
MDKLCTKLLVFEGNGVIKEWVYSYTELRDYQKELASRPAKKVEAPVEAAPAKKKPAGKMTFAEQNELKKIDKDLPALEKKKEELAAEMVAKSADHHAIMQLSIDLEKVTSQLDTLGERWLVLMEKVEGE